MTIRKPSRSEPVEEDAQSGVAARDFFDALAPKRPPKPARSEPLSDDGDRTLGNGSYDGIPPEAVLLQEMVSRSEPLMTAGGVISTDDEHQETEYYTGLTAVGTQHYTTGTGFIKVEDDARDISTRHVLKGTTGWHLAMHPNKKTNPAKDDWEPSTLQMDHPESGKPPRSDP